MVSDVFPFFFPVLIVFFVLLSFVETGLSSMWLPAYFRYGIPLFRREYPLTAMPDLAAKIPELEQKLRRSMWRPAIVFRALNPNEIAFRNKFGNRNPMSGIVRLEPTQNRMRISGHLYWTYLLFPFMLLSFVVTGWGFGVFGLVMIGVFALTMGMQWYQYTQIAAVIAETAVIAPPTLQNPIQTVTYEPDVDTYRPAAPQTGLNNTEIVLIAVLAALLVIGVAAAFLLFG